MDRKCGWCDKSINELKANAVYCSATCRSAAHRALPCYYCGMPAGEKEHIVPLSVKRSNNIETVPTCFECNRLASTSTFDSPEEKRLYIKRQLLKKYNKILKIPDWTEKEINELGPSLKNHVLASQELKYIILGRLSWELPVK